MKYGPISIEDGDMKGAPLFHGTDVPVKAFFEYLEAEKSVQLEPGVLTLYAVSEKRKSNSFYYS